MEKILPTNVEERKQLFNYGLFILFYNLFTFVIVLSINDPIYTSKNYYRGISL